jgi:hypothetical protein
MKDKYSPRRVSSNWVRRMVSAVSMRGADPRLEIALARYQQKGAPENCNLTYSALPVWTHTLNLLCYFYYTS